MRVQPAAASQKQEVYLLAFDAGRFGALRIAETADENLLEWVRGNLPEQVREPLAWAAALTNPSDRERLTHAIVFVWAERDPLAAITWALARPNVASESYLETAFCGAVKRPELAIEIAGRLFAADPESGSRYGLTLVGALTGAGEFEAAFRFSHSASESIRDEWISVTLHRWAAHDPAEALRALTTITDEAARNGAFWAVVEGWSERDLAGLTAHLVGEPASSLRDRALTFAMFKWGEQDPAALARFTTKLSRGIEWDVGASALVTLTDGANRSTNVALRWAETIADPALRRESVRQVLREWQQSDPLGVRVYVANLPWLSAVERERLLQDLSVHPSPGAAETHDQTPSDD